MIFLIPAKGESSRIPYKNIKRFLGKPILGRTIETVKEWAKENNDNFIDMTVLTNDTHIECYVGKEFCLTEGDSSSDNRTLSDVVLEFLNKSGLYYGTLCLILPTSVFIDTYDIETMLDLHDGKNTTVAMKEIDKKAYNCYSDGKRVNSTYANKISQDIPAPYIDSGQCYIIDIENFLENPVILGDEITMYPMKNDSIDIDTPEDWVKAEEMYKRLYTNSAC